MEEQRYLSTVGESHPRLASVRKEISLLKQQIESIREAERAEAAKINQAINEQKKQEDDANVFKPLSPDERLNIRMNAMAEALAALDIEEKGLRELAVENEAQSKKLSAAIQDVEYLNRELEQVKSLQEAYVEKIRQLELRPKDSQRSLKELNLPKTGYLYGPRLPPYLLGGERWVSWSWPAWPCCSTWQTKASAVPKISLPKSVRQCWDTSQPWNWTSWSSVRINW